MEHSYSPTPIDTSDIALSEDLAGLTEAMARNVHEVWAAGRIKEGWTFGAIRNDQNKTHPCLIPYEQLPESEREYDRQTAIQTLKLIMKLGYTITQANH